MFSENFNDKELQMESHQNYYMFRKYLLTLPNSHCKLQHSNDQHNFKSMYQQLAKLCTNAQITIYCTVTVVKSSIPNRFYLKSCSTHESDKPNYSTQLNPQCIPVSQTARHLWFTSEKFQVSAVFNVCSVLPSATVLCLYTFSACEG
jgi:hypothetical protein